MKLFTITFYKLKMMFSDRLFFAAMIVIPLFIAIAAGNALRYEKLNIIPVVIADEDSSDYSKTLIERIMKKEGLSVVITDRESAVKAVGDGRAEAAFIVKKGFEEKIRSGENKEIVDFVKSPASFSADFVSEVFAGEVIRFTADNMAAAWVAKQYGRLNKKVSDGLMEEVILYTDKQWEPQPLMTINYQELVGSSPQKAGRVSMPAATAASAGIMVVFIMLYVLFSSGWLIEERTNGTLKRLVSGPDALGYSFMGSIFALMLSGLLQITLFAAVNKLVFGVDLFPGNGSYVIFGAYLLSVISISLFLSSVLKTPEQMQAGAPVFALLTGFAGGCFWNFVEVSKPLKQISLLTPQGWALEGVNRMILNPGAISFIILPVAVLLAISLILLPLSYIIIGAHVRN